MFEVRNFPRLLLGRFDHQRDHAFLPVGSHNVSTARTFAVTSQVSVPPDGAVNVIDKQPVAAAADTPMPVVVPVVNGVGVVFMDNVFTPPDARTRLPVQLFHDAVVMVLVVVWSMAIMSMVSANAELTGALMQFVVDAAEPLEVNTTVPEGAAA